MLLIGQNSDKQTITDFQMNATEPYPIVNPARIVGNFGQSVLVRSFEIYAIEKKLKEKFDAIEKFCPVESSR